MVRKEFPEVGLVESPTNVGYAGGCNLGIRASGAPYVALLNNDTEVEPDWLQVLVDVMEEDEGAAAVQPKMVSLKDRSRFDYCGAAGGEMDVFGYPFAWGRLFGYTEKDEGQYDERRQVFWASGAACLLRRSALERVGLLDEAFFAHMEEIDLNWRLQWAGYRVMVEPRAVVYHETGGTLKAESFRKMLLNHRNNSLMILKNHTAKTLAWLLPVRFFLDAMTFVAFLLMGQPRRSVAVVAGLWGALRRWKVVLDGRRRVRFIRTVNEKVLLNRMYGGSVALTYYVKGVRRIRDIRFYASNPRGTCI